MLSKLLVVALAKLDDALRIDERLGARGIDCWARVLERVGIRCWPDYDGEGFRDLLL